MLATHNHLRIAHRSPWKVDQKGGKQRDLLLLVMVPLLAEHREDNPAIDCPVDHLEKLLVESESLLKALSEYVSNHGKIKTETFSEI